MPQKTDIWIPIYIGDLVADMSRADFGSYLLLIFAYWRRHGPLPDDDKALSEAARVAMRDWPPVRKVLAEFFQVGGGVWRHKRVDAELASAQSAREAKSHAGRLGNALRWANKSQRDTPANRKHVADGVAHAIANTSQTGSLAKISRTDLAAASGFWIRQF